MPQIGGACNNESRTAGNEQTPPIPGNQYLLSGRNAKKWPVNEVAVTPWWDGRTSSIPRPLVSVFRFKNEKYRKQIAEAMITSCSNANVGYSNTNRYTFEQEVSKLPGGFTIANLGKVSKPCDTDCSCLVALCFKCVTGVNLGYTDTRHMQEAIRNTGLCTEIRKFSEKVQSTGEGLQIGDICVWRQVDSQGQEGYSGHTAIVVDLSNSLIVSNQIYIDTGLTNIVISAEDQDGKIKLFGQDSSYSVDGSEGTLKLSFYDEKSKKDVDIVKVIAVGNDGIPRMIYGFPETDIAFAMIGDSRTIQLGKNILKEGNVNYKKQWGLIPDSSIFAYWGGMLMNGKSLITGQLYLDNITNYVKMAAEEKFECANFWFGINDIQNYKKYFLGEVREEGETQEEAQEKFIKKWVGLYKQIVDYYIRCYGIFDKQSNQIYITSIVSTSTKEKDYFDEQGPTISLVNSYLKQWADEVTLDWKNQGFDEESCWLKYVELNKKKDGTTYSNAQDFVSDSDFVDNIHFTENWYIYKFIPNYNFNRFEGEIDLDKQIDFKQDNVKELPKQIYKYFGSNGYSKAFAVGIIANMYQESSLNPEAQGDMMELPGMSESDYTSFGICQWHNSTYSQGEQQGFGKDMMDWCSSHGGDWKTNLSGQLSWLLETMYNNSVAQRYFTEQNIKMFNSMKTLQNSKQGAEKIAELFVRNYEKPSNIEAEVKIRVSLAKQFWSKLSQE